MTNTALQNNPTMNPGSINLKKLNNQYKKNTRDEAMRYIFAPSHKM